MTTINGGGQQKQQYTEIAFRDIYCMKLFYAVVPPLVIQLPSQPKQRRWLKKFPPQSDTGIVDSGETHLYTAPLAPHCPPNTSASKISVGTATRHVEGLSVTATLTIPQLAEDIPTTRYIMTSFTNTLVRARPIWGADYKVLFTKEYVTVFSPGGKPILTGWRKNNFRDYDTLL